MLSSVACLSVPHFSALSHKRYDFPKKVIDIKCVLISCTNFYETFNIVRRIQRDIIIDVRSYSGKSPLFLSDFNESLNFSTDFRTIFKYKI